VIWVVIALLVALIALVLVVWFDIVTTLRHVSAQVQTLAVAFDNQTGEQRVSRSDVKEISSKVSDMHRQFLGNRDRF